MDELINSILSERLEISKELSNIIKTCASLNLSKKSSEILYKYMIPAIYANWERFIKNTIKFQIIFLNKQNFSSDELGIDILTSIIDDKNLFKKNFNDFNKKKDFVHQIQYILKNPIIEEENPKISTLNFKKTNKLLLKYHLKPISEEYKDGLNELVHLRSYIAHGEPSGKTFDMQIVRKFVFLIEDLMDNVIINSLSNNQENMNK